MHKTWNHKITAHILPGEGVNKNILAFLTREHTPLHIMMGAAGGAMGNFCWTWFAQRYLTAPPAYSILMTKMDIMKNKKLHYNLTGGFASSSMSVLQTRMSIK